MRLTPKFKCLIKYIFDKCDVAGIWTPNWILASACIGEQVCEADLSELSEQVKKLPGGKFFIPDFIDFQYGELSEKCKPHQKVISILKKNNLLEENTQRVLKGYTYPLERDKEKDMDKEEEKEKEKPRATSLPEIHPLEKKINSFFNLNEMQHYQQLTEVGQFVHHLNRTGKEKTFEPEFDAYCAYKTASGDKVHTLRKFLGTPEKMYTDGGWCADNWQEALKKYQKNGHNQGYTAKTAITTGATRKNF